LTGGNTESAKERVLDVGCGRNKLPGAIGIDRGQNSLADVYHDLDHFPYPFKDNSFDRIHCSHCIEHLKSVVGVMGEFHRIVKPGGRVYMVTPHFSSIYSWSEPTHIHHMSSRTFLEFTDDRSLGSYYVASRFRQIRSRIIFSKSVISLIPRLIYRLSPWHYEKHFAFIFPANDVEFELEVIK
jgi:SAM-dependent methyltransferase